VTVYKVLSDIVEALRTIHLEHEAIRAEMTTKEDLAGLEAVMRREFEVVHKEIRGLALEFEAFRHDTKVTLDMIGELMARTTRHEESIADLDRRMNRVERHLKLKPLPNRPGDR
jgi:hypothetical protein